MSNQIEFTRVNNDVNGNPRYVCNFSHFLTDSEIADLSPVNRLTIAKNRANSLGGKLYSRKGLTRFVFQSFNIKETEQDILSLLNN